MKDLEQLRNEINLIDEKLKQLFLKRLDVAMQIGNYKKEHNLPVLNQAREDEMFAYHRSTISDDKIWQLYQSFLANVILLSKEVQK